MVLAKVTGSPVRYVILEINVSSSVAFSPHRLHCDNIQWTPNVTVLIFDTPCSNNVAQMRASVLNLGKVAHLRPLAVIDFVGKKLLEAD